MKAMTRKTPNKVKVRKPARPKPKAGRPAAQADSEKARALLLEAAIRLFAQKGFDGASVKDISDRAGANVSLISYHFGGKVGLYKTCLEQFGKNRLAATERLLQTPQTRAECNLRLGLFIDDMAIWFEEEPDLCAIIQRESDMGFPIARDVFENTFLKAFTTFVAFIKSGQSRGFLRKDFDPQISASLVFGGLISMMRKDHITKKEFGVSIQDPLYRAKIKDQVCRFFFEGLGKVEE